MPDAVLLCSPDLSSNPGASYGRSPMVALNLPTLASDTSMCKVYHGFMSDPQTFKEMSTEFNMGAVLLSPRVLAHVRVNAWSSITRDVALQAALEHFAESYSQSEILGVVPKVFHETRRYGSSLLPVPAWPQPQTLAPMNPKPSTSALVAGQRSKNMSQWLTETQFPLQEALVIKFWRKSGLSNRHAVATFAYWYATVLKLPLLIIDVPSQWCPGPTLSIFEWPEHLVEYGVPFVKFIHDQKLADEIVSEIEWKVTW